MPSPRYTVRLPPALDTLVQARVQAGTPFAVLIREALAAYLADSPPTGADHPADSAADILTTLQEALDALTRRVEALEQMPTGRRHRADTVLTPANRRRHPSADRPPTGRRQAPPYDPTRFTLGRLCPRGHDYQGTGQSLRRRHNGECAQCNIDQQRERRQRQREQRET